MAYTNIYIYDALTSHSALDASRGVELNWRYLKSFVIGFEDRTAPSFTLLGVGSCHRFSTNFSPLVTSQFLKVSHLSLMAAIMPLSQRA
jgi:hypothetical protein